MSELARENAPPCCRAIQKRNRRVAQKARNKVVLGVAIHVCRRIDLQDLSILHDRDAVAHGHGLDLIMRHENGRDAGLLLNAADF